VSAAPLEQRLKAEAYATGFDLAGIATLGPAETAAAFDEWLRAGYAGDMHYLERHADIRRDSTRAEPGMRAALVVALNYGNAPPSGPIARYARGADYHRVMWDKLDTLGHWFTAATGARTRSYVDTGPVLERDLARRAGLGWFGKNTNLINPRLGSFFFIGALFLEHDLAPDAPFEADRCGSCTRCLDACPTAAFTAPRSLDATRCISYLTIESRTAIPEPLRAPVGEWMYGCDVCQDVCPWNVRFATPATEPLLEPQPSRTHADPVAWLLMDESAFKADVKDSAMNRVKRRQIARNAAVVLGNRRDPATIAALATALNDDPDPMVREHARWALEQFGDQYEARHALRNAKTAESPQYQPPERP
jgi:epoxyqueuosine reductase